VVVIASALVPILLKSGDDAAKNMQDRDSDIWNKRD
jgi:cobalamin biosynthesis Co2+ chelatase CbiK